MPTIDPWIQFGSFGLLAIAFLWALFRGVPGSIEVHTKTMETISNATKAAAEFTAMATKAAAEATAIAHQKSMEAMAEANKMAVETTAAAHQRAIEAVTKTFETTLNKMLDNQRRDQEDCRQERKELAAQNAVERENDRKLRHEISNRSMDATLSALKYGQQMGGSTDKEG